MESASIRALSINELANFWLEWKNLTILSIMDSGRLDVV